MSSVLPCRKSHDHQVEISDTEFEDCCSSLNLDQSSPLHWTQITESPEHYGVISTQEMILTKKFRKQFYHGGDDNQGALRSFSAMPVPVEGNQSLPAKEDEDEQRLPCAFPPFSFKDSTTFAGFVRSLTVPDDGMHDHQDEELEGADDLSPTTVLEAAASSSSASTPSASKATDFNELAPFPASFPSAMTSMDALLTASNDFSFSMSQAVPASPPEKTLYDLLELKFDGFGCEHQLPGRLDVHDNRDEKLQSRGFQRLSNSLAKSFSYAPHLFLPQNTTQHVRSQSLAYTSKPEKQFNFGGFFSSSNNEISSRSSSKNSRTSSEFSIELGNRSGRYLDLDFTKDAEEQQDPQDSNFQFDARSNVEEVVCNKDDSKFTSSPVSSAFLFVKSDTSCSDDYINFQPKPSPTSHGEESNVVQRFFRSGSQCREISDSGKPKVSSVRCCLLDLLKLWFSQGSWFICCWRS
ncbi:uncharacterized protein LOC112346249 isoform X1 [Selaginella moellendorffii]|uniref:uncharacterized protein LOC112346249 isoform X1 n=1 Tax=Selaginella moellendorffii TaxID=88036 RepID=UPI000D1CD868|nr:uncharacterized protein LOC112346249 isoform X1 [Selaginella moellendorffii]|eukprot:XP_024530505.1 uncharacterized protein LOC112346249 isoform X1 [Selaginella moellendorffii]